MIWARVCPCRSQFGKFVRLVIQDQDGFRLIQAFCQLLGRHALLDPPSRPFPVRPANEIEGVVDQQGFILHKLNIGICKESVHPRVAFLFFV